MQLEILPGMEPGHANTGRRPHKRAHEDVAREMASIRDPLDRHAGSDHTGDDPGPGLLAVAQPNGHRHGGEAREDQRGMPGIERPVPLRPVDKTRITGIRAGERSLHDELGSGHESPIHDERLRKYYGIVEPGPAGSDIQRVERERNDEDSSHRGVAERLGNRTLV